LNSLECGLRVLVVTCVSPHKFVLTYLLVLVDDGLEKLSFIGGHF